MAFQQEPPTGAELAPSSLKFGAASRPVACALCHPIVETLAQTFDVPPEGGTPIPYSRSAAWAANWDHTGLAAVSGDL